MQHQNTAQNIQHTSLETLSFYIIQHTTKNPLSGRGRSFKYFRFFFPLSLQKTLMYIQNYIVYKDALKGQLLKQPWPILSGTFL